MTCQEKSVHQKVTDNSNNNGSSYEAENFAPVAEQSISLRDKAMISRISEPSATLLKLDRMESAEPKKKTSTVSIPFSAGTTWESQMDTRKKNNSKDGSSHDNVLRQLRELKNIHDSLTVEANKKEKQLNKLTNAIALRQIGDTKKHKCIVEGEKALTELQTRLDQIEDMMDLASGVDLLFQGILVNLHNYDPTTQNGHLQIQSQIDLSRQQIIDLKNERGSIMKEIDKIQGRAMKFTSDIKSVAQERQRLAPLLESLRARANEEEERKKNARVASFDPSSFSRRVRLAGRIAKRREDKLKHSRPIGAYSADEMDKASELHPMERISQAAGTHDPASIATMLKEDETQQLRGRQEKGEIELKEQRQQLESLRSQIQDLSLVDGDNDVLSTQPDDIVDAKAVISSKQQQLQTTSQLVQNVSLAILNVSDKVESIERDRRLSEFALFTRDAARMTTVAPNSRPNHEKKLARLVKSLQQEVPSELISYSRKESHKRESQPGYQNVRILNRGEREATFAKSTKHLHELEDKDVGDSSLRDADEDFSNLSLYVNEGIQTNESQNQQRRANSLSHEKQGRYASKGLILETVMQTSSSKNNKSP